MIARNSSAAPTNNGTKMSVNIDSHWLLIRGLAREARHWGGFPEKLRTALSAGAETARVDCIDLPGAGCFSEMRSPLNIADITEFVREKFLEIRRRQRESGEHPRKTYLCAISLGGMVASQWLDQWTRDIDGCVLINTSFNGFSPLHQRLQPRTLGHFVGILRNLGDAIESERHVLEMVSNRPEIREATAREWGAIHLSRPVSLENTGRQLIAAARFHAPARPPDVPVLLLSSIKDRMVHPACSEEIARRWPKAEFRRHAEAGHDLPLDDADWTVAEIANWYRALTPQ